MAIDDQIRPFVKQHKHALLFAGGIAAGLIGA